MSDWDIELAKLFKERNNKQNIGNIIGKVIKGFPDLQISILDGNVILYTEQLYCCDHVLKGYKREYKNKNMNIKGFSANSATSTHRSTSGIYENYTYSAINIPDSTVSEETGTITFTDTLKVNDEVLLTCTEDGQTWFIIDKITKL